MPNNKKICFSTTTVDFFPEDPPTRRARVKSFAKRSRWPMVIGLFCAAIVVVGMIVGSGGLAIPGALFLGSFKIAIAVWAKRTVITLCGFAGFGIGFGLAKWMGIGKPKPVASFILDMQQDLNRSYHRDLKQELAVSSCHDQAISSYCAADDTVFLRDKQDEESESSYKRSQVFIPLRDTNQTFEDKQLGCMGRLTHYQEEKKQFRVYYEKGNEELDLTQNEINARINYVPPTHTQSTTRRFIDRLALEPLKPGRGSMPSIPAAR